MILNSQKGSALKILEQIYENVSNLTRTNKETKQLQNIVKSMKTIIIESSEDLKKDALYLPENITITETYEYTHNIGDSDFTFTWNIDYLSSLLNDRNQPTVNILANNIEIMRSAIESRGNIGGNDNPIIIIAPCYVGPYVLVINGSHRINDIKESNSEEKTIDGFIVRDNIHTEAMMNELMNNFYLICQDMLTIAKHYNYRFFWKRNINKTKFNFLYK